MPWKSVVKGPGVTSVTSTRLRIDFCRMDWTTRIRANRAPAQIETTDVGDFDRKWQGDWFIVMQSA